MPADAPTDFYVGMVDWTTAALPSYSTILAARACSFDCSRQTCEPKRHAAQIAVQHAATTSHLLPVASSFFLLHLQVLPFDRQLHIWRRAELTRSLRRLQREPVHTQATTAHGLAPTRWVVSPSTAIDHAAAFCAFERTYYPPRDCR